MKRKLIRFSQLCCIALLAIGCSDDSYWDRSLDKDDPAPDGIVDEEGDAPGGFDRTLSDPAAALALPNSYMVTPGGSVDIPVAKGYAVWSERADAFGEADLSGEPKAAVVWSEPAGLLAAAPVLSGDGADDAVIRVACAPGVEGNALVALEIGGTIRWSWHVWVTSYRPDEGEAAVRGATPVEGGTLYRYNNGTGDYVLMDRNLGALSADPRGGTNRGTWGMFYQWGRKDPFPGTSYRNEKPEYPPVNNLAAATENPDVFLVQSSLGDWYSYRNKQDHDLWGAEQRAKSIYDPCPEGWMVPLHNRKLGEGYVNADQYGFNGSPWNGLQHYVEGPDAFTWIPGEYPGIESPAAGFYPAAGYLTPNGGELWWGPDEIRKWGYYWTAEAWTATNPHDAGMMLFCNSARFELYASLEWKRAHGFQVRCVKEEK